MSTERSDDARSVARHAADTTTRLTALIGSIRTVVYDTPIYAGVSATTLVSANLMVAGRTLAATHDRLHLTAFCLAVISIATAIAGFASALANRHATKAWIDRASGHPDSCARTAAIELADGVRATLTVAATHCVAVALTAAAAVIASV